jgi:hypothetical protein
MTKPLSLFVSCCSLLIFERSSFRLHAELLGVLLKGNKFVTPQIALCHQEVETTRQSSNLRLQIIDKCSSTFTGGQLHKLFRSRELRWAFRYTQGRDTLEQGRFLHLVLKNCIECLDDPRRTPPAGGLYGIRNNRRRLAALCLDLAKRAESTGRESFLELTMVTLNYYIQLHRGSYPYLGTE